jgi:ABC-type cobalt transport system substrate-binding protein
MFNGQRLTFVLAALAALAALLGAYVAGYFWLGKRMDHLGLSAPTRIESIQRQYSQPWLASLYQPAGQVEELLRQVDVEVVGGP